MAERDAIDRFGPSFVPAEPAARDSMTVDEVRLALEAMSGLTVYPTGHRAARILAAFAALVEENKRLQKMVTRTQTDEVAQSNRYNQEREARERAVTMIRKHIGRTDECMYRRETGYPDGYEPRLRAPQPGCPCRNCEITAALEPAP